MGCYVCYRWRRRYVDVEMLFYEGVECIICMFFNFVYVVDKFDEM